MMVRVRPLEEISAGRNSPTAGEEQVPCVKIQVSYWGCDRTSSCAGSAVQQISLPRPMENCSAHTSGLVHPQAPQLAPETELVSYADHQCCFPLGTSHRSVEFLQLLLTQEHLHSQSLLFALFGAMLGSHLKVRQVDMVMTLGHCAL